MIYYLPVMDNGKLWPVPRWLLPCTVMYSESELPPDCCVAVSLSSFQGKELWCSTLGTPFTSPPTFRLSTALVSVWYST